MSVHRSKLSHAHATATGVTLGPWGVYCTTVVMSQPELSSEALRISNGVFMCSQRNLYVPLWCSNIGVVVDSGQVSGRSGCLRRNDCEMLRQKASKGAGKTPLPGVTGAQEACRSRKREWELQEYGTVPVISRANARTGLWQRLQPIRLNGQKHVHFSVRHSRL